MINYSHLSLKANNIYLPWHIDMSSIRQKINIRGLNFSASEENNNAHDYVLATIFTESKKYFPVRRKKWNYKEIK